MKIKARLTLAALLAVCLLSGCGRVPDDQITEKYLKTLLQQASQLNNVAYSIDTSNGTYQAHSEYNIKGGKTRIEMSVNGGDPTVTILDQDSSVSYSTTQKTGTKTAYSASYSYTPADYSGVTDRISLSFLRREKLELGDCIVATMTQENAPDATIWIHEKNGLVLKNESQNGLGDCVVQVTRLEMNQVADEVFQVPEDVQITDRTQE